MARMIRRFGLLYVVFALVVVFALTILVVVRLNTARELNLQIAETSFIRLQGRVRASLIDPAVDLAVSVREYAQQVSIAEAIVVYEPENGIRYVWTSDIELFGFARSDLESVRGFPTYRLREISQVKLTTPLVVDQSNTIYVDGVYQVLSFTDAYEPLRDSLIALVVFAFVTVLIAIGISMSRRAEEPHVRLSADIENEGRPAGATSAIPEPRPAVEPEAPIEVARPAQASASAAAPRQPAPRANERIDPVARASTVGPETHVDPVIEPEMEEVEIEEIATDPGEPGTLFSPITGLSYREHLERRLGLELERAAYNDQDLSCIIVMFEGLHRDSEAYVLRANQVLSSFQFEDLCFEFGNDSFCMIMPNAELSRAIRSCEEFKDQYTGQYFFGISSRNGRLVEAVRILAEAERSLEHARNEPGGIVGFRPDPRKYRQFVTQHLRNE